jgi:hypothetical protein
MHRQGERAIARTGFNHHLADIGEFDRKL